MLKAAIVALVSVCVLEQGNCYDPDVYLPTPAIIRRHGYPAESHTIQTADGYLLTLHRIPSGRNSSASSLGPVFIQHGLLSSSADWIILGPTQALAYVLADAGYDVWLGNARGNTYSRAHVDLSPSSAEFWDFSFHEMGMYDLPAAIDYVLEKTGYSQLYYVGHSMGTSMFFVMGSTRPEYNSKIRAMVALAPVAFVNHIKSPIRFLAPFSKDIELFAKLVGENEFLPQSTAMKYLGKYVCEVFRFEREVCTNAIFILTGFDNEHLNLTLLPAILNHTPAGASTKTLVHYAQEINSGRFQPMENSKGKEANEVEPTKEYNLKALTAPIFMYYATNDWLASTKDVDALYAQLPNCIGRSRVPLSNFNHVDFTWGDDAKSLIYDRIQKLLEKLPLPKKEPQSPTPKT